MTQVNFNLGLGSPVPTGDLPQAGTKMSIELTPRAADALGRASMRPQLGSGQRVIDSEMIGGKELRTLLEERVTEPLVDESESDNDMGV